MAPMDAVRGVRKESVVGIHAKLYTINILGETPSSMDSYSFVKGLVRTNECSHQGGLGLFAWGQSTPAPLPLSIGLGRLLY